jgi:shikimate 5-dehydrogenase
MASQCHRLAADAAATGVVNTLTIEAHGLVVGHNTDVGGVRGALLRYRVPEVAPGEQNAVVLGTGGGARAGALALLQMGYRVTMLGRSLEPARVFATHHGLKLGSLQAGVLRELQPVVVVHATPVGSKGRADAGDRLLPDWTPESGTFVLDMVYQPSSTPLLQAAAAAGAVAIPGVEMFLTQAQAQVQLFTGERLPEAELRGFLAGTAVSS